MFEKLRNAFSVAAKSFGEKELKEKDIDEVLFELEIALLESDVATEVIDALKDDLKKQLVGSTVNKDAIAESVKQELRKSISDMFDKAGNVNILTNIQEKKEKGEPCIISFMGINGTGKTTTIAKIANLLRENKYSVVIAAADTYRAGAIEQISEHGKRLNIKVIAQNYGSDPAAVARDAVLYAKSHKIDCILIDTAGRMQTSKNLMDQISKINKVVNPDLKIFVGDSLAGNDTVSQAREFYNYTTFDGAILTKSDADARGGAAISIVKVTSSPILYLGVGQEYKDLKSFDKDVFLETLFGPEEIVEGVKKKVLEPKVELKPEPKVELKPASEQEISEDPFTGISTKDIEKYSDLFDVPPPENDGQARKLASDIRQWISAGRPKTKQKDEPKTESKSELKTETEKTEEPNDEKPIKKRSLFGWMKK